jgi:D-3-phosphoglycerate dehydrogenase
MRVVVTDPFWPLDEARDVLDGTGVEVVFAEDMGGDDVVGLLTIPDTPVPGDILEHAPALRVVATGSTGFDHIPVGTLAAAGVISCHVAGYCDEEVAETAVVHAAALLRGVHRLDGFVRAGGWWPYPVQPRRVEGSTLGIVGFGRIGREVARRADRLGMRCVAFDPFAPDGVFAEAGVERSELHELLAVSDVVTLHALLTDATRHLIDADALATMRPEAYLVNCARAGLVDHDALGVALAEGRIAGAALDVFPLEPIPTDEPALAWPNTVVQPHSSWYSPGAERLPYLRAAEAVAAVLRGEEPAGRIGPEGA